MTKIPNEFCIVFSSQSKEKRSYFRKCVFPHLSKTSKLTYNIKMEGKGLLLLLVKRKAGQDGEATNYNKKETGS